MGGCAAGQQRPQIARALCKGQTKITGLKEQTHRAQLTRAQPGPLRPPQARVLLRATDTFGAYCEPRPRQIRLEGQGLVDFLYDEASSMLTVQLPRTVEPAEMVIDFPRQWRPTGGLEVVEE